METLACVSTFFFSQRIHLSVHWPASEVRSKTVWSFWHEGEAKLPPFYALCVKSWRVRLGDGWDVRVLNLVRNDADNLLSFVAAADLPNRFHSIRLPQHQADLARLTLLDVFGGIWCDVGMLMFDSLDVLWDHLLTVPRAKFDQDGHGLGVDPDARSTSAEVCDGSSREGGQGGLCHFFLRSWGSPSYGALDFVEVWFLAAAGPHHPVIRRWRLTFAEYWCNREAATGAADDPFFQHVGLGPGSSIPSWGESTFHANSTRIYFCKEVLV